MSSYFDMLEGKPALPAQEAVVGQYGAEKMAGYPTSAQRTGAAQETVNPYAHKAQMVAENEKRVATGGSTSNGAAVNGGESDGKTTVSTSSVGTAGAANSTGAATTTSAEKTEAEKALDEAAEKRKAGLERYRAWLDGKKPETEADRAKREKKEKRDRMFAAIGDGFASLANLYFTTKGAPNMYDGKNTMSEAARARQEKLKAEREANEKWYYDANARLDELEYGTAKDRVANERAAAKEKREAVLADLNVMLKNHQISKAQYDALTAQFKYENAPQEAEDKHNESVGRQNVSAARVKQSEASSAASRASAHEHNVKAADIEKHGTGGRRAKPTLTIGGKTHEYETQAEYEKNVHKYAKEKGINIYEEVKSGRYNPKATRTKKSISQLAAEVEKAYEQPAKKQSPTGGGGGGGGKKSPTA